MFAPLSRVVITVPPARAKLWIAAAADCDSTVAFCNSSTCTWDEMLARGGTSCLLCEGPVARQYHCKISLARNPVNIERAKFVSGWRAHSADFLHTLIQLPSTPALPRFAALTIAAGAPADWAVFTSQSPPISSDLSQQAHGHDDNGTCLER